jgi:hypothetical protein
MHSFVQYWSLIGTFDHRMLKTRLPVRSALFKQHTGGLVVRWVTTSEYPLLNVFIFRIIDCVPYGNSVLREDSRGSKLLC